MTATADGLSREQVAHLVALAREANQAALADPATTAVYCDPKFVTRPHIDLMSAELARIADGATKRLMIQVPPQSGKSTLVAVWKPLWWLARHPDHKVIIASYGSNLAVNRGRAIRRLVEEHGWRWGLRLGYGSRSVNDWELESGGGIKSVGIGSGVTGFPARLGILDDPHKSRAEADSRLQRDRVWEWYSADWLSRLAPGAPMIIVATPWHEDDLMHRVLDQDGEEDQGGLWRVVKMPALATRTDDPLGRAVGDPLPHPVIPLGDVEAARTHWEGRRASSTVRDWAALYQLDPKPTEGALVSDTLMRDRTHIPPPAVPVKAAVAVDPSGGGRDTAGVIGGYLADDGRVYITGDVTLIGPSEEWARAACQLAASLDAEMIVVESNYGGDMAKTVVRSAWDRLARDNPDNPGYQRLAPQLKMVHAKKGKLLRAEPIAQQFSDDRLRLGAHLPELVHEWQTWQPTDSDSPGRIDASCYLAYALLPVPGAESVVSSPVGVRRDRVVARRGPRIHRPRPGIR